MKNLFHVFHNGLKTFERHRLDVHLFLIFSYHDETSIIKSQGNKVCVKDSNVIQ